jgi:adenine-specific DNA-methyltransferase
MTASYCAPTEYDVGGLGQVFTPPAIVEAMLALVRNRGRVLEPACGDGAFLQHFPFALGIEIDAAARTPRCAGDGFLRACRRHETFATIIGNPPYVRYQDIAAGTRALNEAQRSRWACQSVFVLYREVPAPPGARR